MIEKAEAIVLKTKKYGETSKIINLFTKEFGKLSVIAKGARSKNNRFGSSLEPLSHISIVFYNYENRDLQYITQGSLINFFHSIRNNPSKMMYALPVLEIINNVIHSDEQNEEFFELVINVIKALNESKDCFGNYLLYFELHLASQFGFHPNFDNCEFCGREINHDFAQYAFNIEKGCLICGDCHQKSIMPGINLSSESVNCFQKMLEISPEDMALLSLPPAMFSLMFNLTTKYLKNHISGMRDLRSLEIMGEVV
jgi:DNA repair protein RecO (recombination protein O)